MVQMLRGYYYSLLDKQITLEFFEIHRKVSFNLKYDRRESVKVCWELSNIVIQ